MLFRKPCISSWDRSICPVTSQGAVCPPEHRQFQWGIGTGDCVLHLWTAGCTSTAEGTEVVVSTASSLFVFFPSVALSFLSLLWRTGQTEALFMSLLGLPCGSVTLCLLVPGAALNQTTVLPCRLSKSPLLSAAPLPSSAPRPYCP